MTTDPRSEAASHRLDGQVAIVSGAARGLGAAWCRALRAAGAEVIGFDVRPGSDVTADAADPEQVRRVVSGVVATYGTVDISVANAASFVLTSPLDPWDKAIADFDAMVRDNLRSVYLLGRAVAPVMASAGRGHIVNVSTDHTRRAPGVAPGGGPKMDAYDASKWGIRGLTECWSQALQAHGVRVNELCMGATDGEFLREFMGDRATPELTAKWLDPDEVAAVLVDLLAEGPGGRTGQRIGLWVGHPVRLPPA